MISKLTKLVAVTLLVLAHTASAEVLFDQTDFDPYGPGFFNSESGGPPFGMTVYAVNDVTVTEGWIVESVTTFYSALDPVWGEGITEGKLHVFEKTGSLPITGGDDPEASPVVAMSATLNGDHFVITATGLNLELAPGEYWIGITPNAPSGPFGPEIHLASLTLFGDATASYDPYAFPGPPAWFNFNPGVDASILIEGSVAGTATEEMTWGRLKSAFK